MSQISNMAIVEHRRRHRRPYTLHPNHFRINPWDCCRGTIFEFELISYTKRQRRNTSARSRQLLILQAGIASPRLKRCLINCANR